MNGNGKQIGEGQKGGLEFAETLIERHVAGTLILCLLRSILYAVLDEIETVLIYSCLVLDIHV